MYINFKTKTFIFMEKDKQNLILIGIGVLVVLAALLLILPKLPDRFEGKKELEARLAEWSPESAGTREGEKPEGELKILFYVINGEARRLIRSDVRSLDEVSFLSVLEYGGEKIYGRYTNGEDAIQPFAVVYLLDKDTLSIVAQDVVYGSAPPEEVVIYGGHSDKIYSGKPPEESACRLIAYQLASDLGKEKK